MLDLVENISREAHLGQYRKNGKPYIEHVIDVVSKLKDDDIAKAVAWLHDVLEDTDMKESDLLDAGVSKNIVDIVLLLTKKREQSYDDYINKVRKHEIARKVKIADIISNLNDNPGNKQILKFSKALIKLCGN
ncbi:GTP pyrophosphokinase [Pleionea litopenaei]|uniref:GTP pyrophosphokinase n=1 Tax=Pleionea litopenaei TaxID=3070815 RepID=A0AA51X8A3_9GAMM|nr:GTP pyrophosphokinase [Pleionea sp. HL-JVS1]WMS88751.1 GTP pyrophosphokinase [Pleionea sp. HL-JVS1]